MKHLRHKHIFRGVLYSDVWADMYRPQKSSYKYKFKKMNKHILLNKWGLVSKSCLLNWGDWRCFQSTRIQTWIAKSTTYKQDLAQETAPSNWQNGESSKEIGLWSICTDTCIMFSNQTIHLCVPARLSTVSSLWIGQKNLLHISQQEEKIIQAFFYWAWTILTKS